MRFASLGRNGGGERGFERRFRRDRECFSWWFHSRQRDPRVGRRRARRAVPRPEPPRVTRTAPTGAGASASRHRARLEQQRLLLGSPASRRWRRRCASSTSSATGSRACCGRGREPISIARWAARSPARNFLRHKDFEFLYHFKRGAGAARRPARWNRAVRDRAARVVLTARCRRRAPASSSTASRAGDRGRARRRLFLLGGFAANTDKAPAAFERLRKLLARGPRPAVARNTHVWSSRAARTSRARGRPPDPAEECEDPEGRRASPDRSRSSSRRRSDGSSGATPSTPARGSHRRESPPDRSRVVSPRASSTPCASFGEPFLQVPYFMHDAAPDGSPPHLRAQTTCTRLIRAWPRAGLGPPSATPGYRAADAAAAFAARLQRAAGRGVAQSASRCARDKFAATAALGRPTRSSLPTRDPTYADAFTRAGASLAFRGLFNRSASRTWGRSTRSRWGFYDGTGDVAVGSGVDADGVRRRAREDGKPDTLDGNSSSCNNECSQPGRLQDAAPPRHLLPQREEQVRAHHRRRARFDQGRAGRARRPVWERRRGRRGGRAERCASSGWTPTVYAPRITVVPRIVLRLLFACCSPAAALRIVPHLERDESGGQIQARCVTCLRRQILSSSLDHARGVADADSMGEYARCVDASRRNSSRSARREPRASTWEECEESPPSSRRDGASEAGLRRPPRRRLRRRARGGKAWDAALRVRDAWRHHQGWFFEPGLLRLYLELDAVHECRGVRGALVEVGVFHVYVLHASRSRRGCACVAMYACRASPEHRPEHAGDEVWRA